MGAVLIPISNRTTAASRSVAKLRLLKPIFLTLRGIHLACRCARVLVGHRATCDWRRGHCQGLSNEGARKSAMFGGVCCISGAGRCSKRGGTCSSLENHWRCRRQAPIVTRSAPASHTNMNLRCVQMHTTHSSPVLRFGLGCRGAPCALLPPQAQHPMQAAHQPTLAPHRWWLAV